MSGCEPSIVGERYGNADPGHEVIVRLAEHNLGHERELVAGVAVAGADLEARESTERLRHRDAGEAEGGPDPDVDANAGARRRWRGHDGRDRIGGEGAPRGPEHHDGGEQGEEAGTAVCHRCSHSQAPFHITVPAESRCYHQRSGELLPAGGENRTAAAEGYAREGNGGSSTSRTLMR